MLNQDEKNAATEFPIGGEPLPKFNIRARYDDLNDAKKRIFRHLYQSRFGGNIPTFYNKLSSENLTIDEGLFFADLFECKVEDLYTTAMPRQTSIFDLARKAKGGKPGIREV